MLARTMEQADLQAALAVAESAFFGEKLYAWTAPDADERRAFISRFFQFRLAAGFGKNVMDVAAGDDGQIWGAAVWAPPAPPAPPGGPSLPPGFDRIFLGAGRGVPERCLAFIATVRAAENAFPRPYWMLSPIFIQKEMQGKGIASLLIKKQLENIDAARLPCVLVTQEERNIPIYERYGFKTGAAFPIAPGLSSLGMIREAR